MKDDDFEDASLNELLERKVRKEEMKTCSHSFGSQQIKGTIINLIEPCDFCKIC